MTIRALPTSRLVKAIAIVLVTLVLSPFTQPFSTLGRGDVLNETATHAKSLVDRTDANDIATVESIGARDASLGRHVELQIVESAGAGTTRRFTPLVLRI